MKNKLKFLILSLFLLPTLTGCNNNDNKEIVTGFTVSDAKKYAKIYLKEVKNKDSLKGYELTISRYYGRYNNNKGIALLMDYRPLDLNEPLECDFFKETIGDFTFDYEHSTGYGCDRIRYYEDDKVFTLTEAYNLKLLNLDNIKSIRNFQITNKDQYRVGYKFSNKID